MVTELVSKSIITKERLDEMCKALDGLQGNKSPLIGDVFRCIFEDKPAESVEAFFIDWKKKASGPERVNFIYSGNYEDIISKRDGITEI